MRKPSSAIKLKPINTASLTDHRTPRVGQFPLHEVWQKQTNIGSCSSPPVSKRGLPKHRRESRADLAGNGLRSWNGGMRWIEFDANKTPAEAMKEEKTDEFRLYHINGPDRKAESSMFDAVPLLKGGFPRLVRRASRTLRLA